MARPLRLEFASALYHITSRGDRGEDIYRENADRQQHYRGQSPYWLYIGKPVRADKLASSAEWYNTINAEL